MFRIAFNNFIKGFSLLWNSDYKSYDSNKTYINIFWTNINIFGITFLAKNLVDVFPNHFLLNLLYYIFVIRIFINGMISNIFMSMTLGRIVLNTYREKNLSLNMKKKAFTQLSELIFRESKFIFYSKLYYIFEIIIIFLIQTHSLYYRLFSIYFYGKYITAIYLDIRNISSKIHEKYLARLFFYRLGIGSTIVLLLWLFEILINTNNPSILERIIFNDCFFNIIYGYCVLSLEDSKKAPRLEEYEPFFLSIDSDYLFRKLLILIHKNIINLKIPSFIQSLFKIYIYNLFYVFNILFIDYRIREDILSYPPILKCIEIYQKEILNILHHLLIYKKINSFIDNKVILFFLSIWIPKELIESTLYLLSKLDYDNISKIYERIKNLEIDYFILAEECESQDNFTLIQEAISKEGDFHFYLSETHNLTKKEIKTIISNPSPTINKAENFKIEIMENYFIS